MEKLLKWLVLVLVVAVLLLAGAWWKDHKTLVGVGGIQTDPRVKDIVTWVYKPNGLAAWHSSEPAKIAERFDTIVVKLRKLCAWAERSAPAEMRCGALPPGGPGTGVPKEGPSGPP
jgi:hypothetical protein